VLGISITAYGVFSRGLLFRIHNTLRTNRSGALSLDWVP
jgi:hypothetical protein